MCIRDSAQAAACSEGTAESGSAAFADCVTLAYSRVFATAAAAALIEGECLTADAAVAITASVDAEFETIEGCDRGEISFGDAAGDTDFDGNTEIEVICGALGQSPCDGAYSLSLPVASMCAACMHSVSADVSHGRVLDMASVTCRRSVHRCVCECVTCSVVSSCQPCNLTNLYVCRHYLRRAPGARRRRVRRGGHPSRRGAGRGTD